MRHNRVSSLFSPFKKTVTENVKKPHILYSSNSISQNVLQKIIYL